MSVQFTIGGFYAVSAAVFWERVFFNEGYTQALMVNGLGHKSAQVISLETASNGVVRRRMKVQPKLNIPGPIKRLLGDGFHYIEEGTYDPRRPAFISKITLPSAPKIIEINSTLSFADRKSGGADRQVRLAVKSSKFGLARLIETTSKGILTQQYNEAEAFTQIWLKSNLEDD